MTRLSRAFAQARADGRVALFPYLTAGFPDEAVCEEVLVAAAEAGADGFELGIPFSDPLADGVTIQRASSVALENGASVGMAFDVVADLRRRHDLPIALMSYVNPLLAYGLD